MPKLKQTAVALIEPLSCTSETLPILRFWFEEVNDNQHFIKDTAPDATMRERFGGNLKAAARCELFAWHDSA